MLTTCDYGRVFVELDRVDLPHMTRYPSYSRTRHHIPQEHGSISSRLRELTIIMRPKQVGVPGYGSLNMQSNLFTHPHAYRKYFVSVSCVCFDFSTRGWVLETSSSILSTRQHRFRSSLGITGDMNRSFVVSQCGM